MSSFYLDDAFLVGDSYADCESNTKATLQVLRELGFVIHEEKSKTVPSQIIEHLGFEFNTIEMTVKVTKEKIDKVRGKAASILRKNWVVIREVAQLIGVLVACFPGVEFGQLFYRQLEIDKAAALKLHKGDFDQTMMLSDIAKQDLVWWIENVGMGKKISHGNPVIVLKTDASLTGWGAVLNDKDTGGRWTEPESTLHINALEFFLV